MTYEVVGAVGIAMTSAGAVIHRGLDGPVAVDRGELPDNLCAICQARLNAKHPDTDRISFVNRRVAGTYLPPAQWNIFEALYLARGRSLSFEVLVGHMTWNRHGRSDQMAPEHTLKVHICRLRRMISPARFVIQNIHSYGYRLVDMAT